MVSVETLIDGDENMEEPFENITQAVVYLEDPSRRKNKSERLERGNRTESPEKG